MKIYKLSFILFDERICKFFSVVSERDDDNTSAWKKFKIKKEREKKREYIIYRNFDAKLSLRSNEFVSIHRRKLVGDRNAIQS